MQHGVAVIGLGKIADSHITGWKRLGHSDVRLLVGVDPAKTMELARSYGVASHGTDFGEALRRADIDIVDICTPHHLHAPYTIEALESGKNVLVEKPIAITLADAQRMIETSERTGKTLMVAENIRFTPVYDHGKAILEKGEIGEPFMLTTRAEMYPGAGRFQGPHTGWRSDPAKIGGGALLEAGIHCISMARGLMGEVESVMAIKGKQTRREISVEDTMNVLFNFENGSTGQGSFSWGARWIKAMVDTTIFGTNGILGLETSKDKVWVEQGNERKTWDEPSDGPYHGQWKLIEHFVDCIEHGKTPVTDGVEETKSLRTVLAAYQSAKEGKLVKIDKVS
jgi:predicted dehydrogenase